MKISSAEMSVLLVPNTTANSPSSPWLLQLVCILFIALPFAATAVPYERVVNSFSEIESGTLLIPSANSDRFTTAPLLDTSVKIGVQGMLSRTTVSQTFTNDSNEWIEAVYVFPLPDDASVDALTMIIAGRTTRSEIQTKKKAKKIYETAKRAGKKTSLLEQQRANLFTTRVANIPPGESVQIDIAYQSTVRYSDGKFELYFPLTITPRYIPGTSLAYDARALETSSGNGWALPTDQVPDADLVTPPMTDSPSAVSIVVSLDTGLQRPAIESSTHEILKTSTEDNGNPVQEITLANSVIPADRDFKLSWTPQANQAPVAAVFRHDTQQEDNTLSFASLMLMPPQQVFSDSVLREVIFVMDTSSSMGGNSIRQARETLTLGIEGLANTDTFNVIEFNSTSRKLFSQTVEANDENKTVAIDWVKQLYANNGTEILGAMKKALADSHKNDRQGEVARIRQIVFVTDGSVGNEDEIFRYLQQNIGNSRLFTIGIGSAPNTWFMRKAAELGRGTYTTIANSSELTEKTLKLLTKLERPVLTDIQVSFETDSLPEVFPTIFPDVYMGEPVLADARWNNKLTGGHVIITGKYAGVQWSQKLKLNQIKTPHDSTDNSSTKGLDKLWAYRKIQSLEDQLLFGADTQETEDAITEVALNHSLVTRYTSLVAVEEAISRDPENAPLKTAAIPQAMPHGNTMMFPQGSLGTTARFLLSILIAVFSILFALATLRQTKEINNRDIRPL